jgi:hypothetical protein
LKVAAASSAPRPSARQRELRLDDAGGNRAVQLLREALRLQFALRESRREVSGIEPQADDELAE